jgi:hypothetical protein
MPIDDALSELTVVKSEPKLIKKNIIPAFERSYLYWRDNLLYYKHNKCIGASIIEGIADVKENLQSGENSLQYVRATSEYFHEGNKEKFIECLKKASVSRSKETFGGFHYDGWNELRILADYPEETYERVLADKDSNLKSDDYNFFLDS